MQHLNGIVRSSSGVDCELSSSSRGPLSYAAEDADDLLVVSGFLRRPRPELRIVRLDASEILAA